MHNQAIRIYELLNKIRGMDPEDLRYNDLINDLCSYHEEELKKDFIEKCQSSNQSLLDGSKEQFEIEFQTWLGQQIAYAYSL